jgi:phosphoribosylaminoimidazole-succinocarboxamide synthase
MRVIFLTSGAGSTAFYIINRNDYSSGIVNMGIVYEPNEEIDKKMAILKSGEHKYRNSKDVSIYYSIKRSDFASNDDYHNDIFNKIKDLKLDVIVLAGWMHIVPKSFIKASAVLNIKIINLHPTLQYQLIGRDIYPKIWKMYQDGMIRETGCMVHYVSAELDRGSLITETKIDLTKFSSYEKYHDKMYGNHMTAEIGLEKLCLWQALNKLVNEINSLKKEPVDITPATFSKVNNLVLKHRGKVRDIYETGNEEHIYKDYLFVQTSDRISANDIIIAYLPQKGYLLNQINAFWHKLFGIEQMICATDANLMIVRKMRAIPLEIIVRRRITGSLWKAYSQQGIRVINGYELDNGMSEGDMFDEPIVTPTTKGEHDIPITFDEIVEHGYLNRKEVNLIRDKAVALFKMGEDYMKHLGIKMIDTKFEFGFSNNNTNTIEIIDELFTPDSSRFIVDGIKMDKDILRRWAIENKDLILGHQINEDGCHNVQLPEDISTRLHANYNTFLNKLLSYKLNYRCVGNNVTYNLDMAISKMVRYVVIIAGSKSDSNHVIKICNELAKKDILAFVHYKSAHKNTQDVMDILQYYETQYSANIIYITCAGLSNALSGVVSANVTRPVIACPPFNDKADYLTNIHSTLQMPSSVPSACILRPDNIATFCKNIFSLCNKM